MGRGGNLRSSDGVVHANIGAAALGYDGIVKVGVRGEQDIKEVEAWVCRDKVYLFLG